MVVDSLLGAVPCVVAVNRSTVGPLSVHSERPYLDMARKAEVVPQMRSRQRSGHDLGYLFVLAVTAVAFSVVAIAVVVEHMLLQPVAAVA